VRKPQGITAGLKAGSCLTAVVVVVGAAAFALYYLLGGQPERREHAHMRPAARMWSHAEVRACSLHPARSLVRGPVTPPLIGQVANRPKIVHLVSAQILHLADAPHLALCYTENRT
jgi:hypothetical protein